MAGLPLAGANNRGGIAAWKFTAVEQRLEDSSGLWGQPVEPDFLLRPQQDSGAQLVRLPALLVTDTDSPGDTYPHRKGERIVTIHSYLSDLLARG